MTVGFDRTADCQGNHPSLTEFLRILTEHYWLCFDRTTSLTEHLGNLGFDRTVNGEMFCQKNVISRVFCHIYRHFKYNFDTESQERINWMFVAPRLSLNCYVGKHCLVNLVLSISSK